MKKKKLLITGFEPFHGGTVNPSWEAVAALPEQIGEWELTKLRIPVIFGKAGEAVLKKAETLGPDVILCVGQAGGRNAVTPEVLAVNVKDAPFPDNAGQLPVKEPVVPGGECAYFSTVPVRNLVRKVREAGISCRLSYSAGVYVCNDVLYRVLERYHGTETKAGFVHVPFLPEQAGEGQPSMTLEEMTRALTAAVMALDGDCAAEYRSIGTEEIDLGARLCFFSPIHDERIPADAEGLLLYGGYPELYARELAENASMRESVREGIAGGLPHLAECGGFLYLHEELEDMNGQSFPGCASVAGKGFRTPKLSRFGYVILEAEREGVLGGNGPIKGHEFHYFDSTSCGEDFTARKPLGGRSWKCIHAGEAFLEGFPHLYYYSRPEFAAEFLEKCAEFGRKEP